MKSLSWIVLLASALASCTTAKTTSQGNTEDDEAYYNGKRTFVTEIPAGMIASNDSTLTAVDDYYDPNASQSSLYDQFNRTGGVVPGMTPSLSSGFSNSSLMWRPYVGWGLSNFGSGMYCGMGSFYNPYNSFYPYMNSPFANPYANPYFGFNTWNGGFNGWNMWNDPWNPYGFGNFGFNQFGGVNTFMPWPNYGFYGNNFYYSSLFNDGGSNVQYSTGHRRPLGSISSLNTSASGSSNRPNSPKGTYSPGTLDGNSPGKGNRGGGVVYSNPGRPSENPSSKGGRVNNGDNRPSRPVRSSTPSSSPSRSGGGRDWGNFNTTPSVGGGGSRGGSTGGGSGGGRSGGGGNSGGHRR